VYVPRKSLFDRSAISSPGRRCVSVADVQRCLFRLTREFQVEQGNMDYEAAQRDGRTDVYEVDK
jgi:hypothetical protein